MSPRAKPAVPVPILGGAIMSAMQTQTVFKSVKYHLQKRSGVLPDEQLHMLIYTIISRSKSKLIGLVRLWFPNQIS